MTAITKNHKIGYNSSTVQDSDMQWKPNTTAFGSIFKLNTFCIINRMEYNLSASLKNIFRNTIKSEDTLN